MLTLSAKPANLPQTLKAIRAILGESVSLSDLKTALLEGNTLFSAEIFANDWADKRPKLITLVETLTMLGEKPVLKEDGEAISVEIFRDLLKRADEIERLDDRLVKDGHA